jgi:hypothetical protein
MPAATPADMPLCALATGDKDVSGGEVLSLVSEPAVAIVVVVVGEVFANVVCVGPVVIGGDSVATSDDL